jgi:hypothetical protein
MKKLQKAEPVVVGALHADVRDEHPRETAEESQTEDTWGNLVSIKNELHLASPS